MSTIMFTSSVLIMAKRRERGSVKQRGNVWRVRVAAGIDLATVSGRLSHAMPARTEYLLGISTA